MSESGFKPLTVTISVAIHKLLRAEAKRTGIKLKYLVEELLRDGLAKKAA